MGEILAYPNRLALPLLDAALRRRAARCALRGSARARKEICRGDRAHGRARGAGRARAHPRGRCEPPGSRARGAALRARARRRGRRHARSPARVRAARVRPRALGRARGRSRLGARAAPRADAARHALDRAPVSRLRRHAARAALRRRAHRGRARARLSTGLGGPLLLAIRRLPPGAAARRRGGLRGAVRRRACSRRAPDADVRRQLRESRLAALSRSRSDGGAQERDAQPLPRQPAGLGFRARARHRLAGMAESRAPGLARRSGRVRSRRSHAGSASTASSSTRSTSG